MKSVRCCFNNLKKITLNLPILFAQGKPKDVSSICKPAPILTGVVFLTLLQVFVTGKIPSVPLQTLGRFSTERSSESNETLSSREGSPLEDKGEGKQTKKKQVLYRVSLADQEYLAFSLWQHEWKASGAAETNSAAQTV